MVDQPLQRVLPADGDKADVAVDANAVSPAMFGAMLADKADRDVDEVSQRVLKELPVIVCDESMR